MPRVDWRLDYCAPSVSSAASSNLTILVNTRGCISPQIFHCKVCNDSILETQIFLNMNVVNICVIEMGCIDRDYTG